MVFIILYIYFSSGKDKSPTLELNEELLRKVKKILINNDVSLNTTNNIIKKISSSFQESCSLEDLQKAVSSHIYTLLETRTTSLFTLQEKFYNNNYGRHMPLVFVLLGNNGVGKTSFAMKLAQYFIARKIPKEKILITSLDFFRAGASKQLEILAKSIEVKYLVPTNNSKGQAYDTYEYARKNEYDIVILDTSGRMHTNDNLLVEIKDIMKSLNTLNAHVETIMVMDNNFGGIALSSFEAFSNVVKISGLVITKTDTYLGGGWLLKLLEQNADLCVFGHVNGESKNSFQELNVQEYCNKIVNWTELNE